MKKLVVMTVAALLMLSSCTPAEPVSFPIGQTGLSLLVPESFILDEPENEILFMAADEERLNSATVHVDDNGYTVEMLDELSSNLDGDELSALAQGFLLHALDGEAARHISHHVFELWGRSVFCETDQEYCPDVGGAPVLSLSVSFFLRDGELSYWVTYVESLTGEDVAIRLSEMAAAENLIAFINGSAEELARHVITEN